MFHSEHIAREARKGRNSLNTSVEVAVLVIAGGFFLLFLLVAVLVAVLMAMVISAVLAVVLSFPVGFVDGLEVLPIGTEAVTKRTKKSQFKPSR